MRDHQREFESAGIALAAVGLADLEHARSFRRETGITFPLLVDDERRAYRAVRLGSDSPLAVFSKTNRKARKRAQRAGHRQHGLGKHPLQLGGSFVFGPGDADLVARPAASFGDVAPVAEVLAALPGG